MTVHVGGHVTWHDEYGKRHDALVTALHGPLPTPSINVVVVNMDEGQTDTYGNKIQRETSVPHRDQSNGPWSVLVDQRVERNAHRPDLNATVR